MIRKLVSSDNEKLMNYLRVESSMNLFIIGDIENFGYDTDFMDIWGEFDEGSNIKAVLLRYFGSFIPYSRSEFDVMGFADIIKNSKKLEMFSGKGGVTEKFEDIPGLNVGMRKPMYLCELAGNTVQSSNKSLSIVKEAGIEDIDRIIDLRSTISEFSSAGNNREGLKKTFETKSGRTFYIEEDGKMVSCASTSAENSASAMVVGVCTHPDYRERGYASLCMDALCRKLLSEGKILCLFYDNPKAGKIYKKIGFTDIGTWNLYKK